MSRRATALVTIARATVPSPNGNIRPGDNLFSLSIVAVDTKTGEHRRHFQQVHHDIRDYDSPNPIILCDAPYGGIVADVSAPRCSVFAALDSNNGKRLVVYAGGTSLAPSKRSDGMWLFTTLPRT